MHLEPHKLQTAESKLGLPLKWFQKLTMSLKKKLDQVACITDKGPMVIDGFFLPFNITSLPNNTNLKQTMHVNQPSKEAIYT
jgi:hypothetical protein